MYLRLKLIKQNGTGDWRILLVLRLPKKKKKKKKEEDKVKEKKKKVNKISHEKVKKYFISNLLSVKQ